MKRKNNTILEKKDVKRRKLEKEEKKEIVQCAICQENLKEGDNIEQLSCGHKFHDYCVGLWLGGKKNTCPMCRNQEYCTICLKKLGKNKEKIKELEKCKHKFHKKCIEYIASDENECPLCKKKEEEEFEAALEDIDAEEFANPFLTLITSLLLPSRNENTQDDDLQTLPFLFITDPQRTGSNSISFLFIGEENQDQDTQRRTNQHPFDTHLRRGSLRQAQERPGRSDNRNRNYRGRGRGRGRGYSNRGRQNQSRNNQQQSYSSSPSATSGSSRGNYSNYGNRSYSRGGRGGHRRRNRQNFNYDSDDQYNRPRQREEQEKKKLKKKKD